MKKSLPLFAALTAYATGFPGGFAQEARPPQPPPPAHPFGQPGQPPPPLHDPSHRPEGPKPARAGEHPKPGMGDHEKKRPLPQPPAPQPFLGVVTGQLPPALNAQLSIPEGFGLLVQEVLPDSPAASAGVQRHDILKLLNDQQLIEPGQLATLVKAAGKDAEVTLTVIRKGQEQKLTVKVGERLLPMRKKLDLKFGMPKLPPLQDHTRLFKQHAEQMKDHARDLQGELKKRFHERRDEKHGPQPPHLKDAPGEKPAPGPQPDRSVQKDGPFLGEIPILDRLFTSDGEAKVRVQGSTITTVDGNKLRILLKDPEGELRIMNGDGKSFLKATDSEGNVLFEGAIETEGDHAGIPESIRERLKKLHFAQAIEEDVQGGKTGFAFSPDDGVEELEVQ